MRISPLNAVPWKLKLRRQLVLLDVFRHRISNPTEVATIEGDVSDWENAMFA